MNALEKLPTYATTCLLTLLIVAAYSNSFYGGFVLDSSVIVLEDTRLREVSLDNIAQIWRHSYWWPTSVSNLFRPLTTLSYLFNYALLGNRDDPTWYHAINLLLHLLNGLLAWSVVERLTGRRQPALLIAGIWAVHPATTEAVTNVVGRADLLAAFGTLLGIRAWQECNARWLPAVVIAATIAIFSKESGVAIIGVLGLYTILFEPRRIWWWRIRHLLLVAVPLVFFIYQRRQVLSGLLDPIPFVDNPIAGVGFWRGRITALAVIGRYFEIAFWPFRLSSDYSFNEIPIATGTWTEWVTWMLELVALVGVVWMVLRIQWNPQGDSPARRVRPHKGSKAARPTQPRLPVRWESFLVMAVGFATLTFLPGSNLIFTTGTIMGDRLLYLPLLGVLAVAFIGVAGLMTRERRLPSADLIIAGLVLTLFGIGTWSRNRDWYDEVALWTSAVRVAPDSFKAHQGPADALFEANPGDLDRTIEESEHSVNILDRLADVRPPVTWGATSFAYRRAAAYHLQRGDRFMIAGNKELQRADHKRALMLATTYLALLESDPLVDNRRPQENGEARVLLSDIQARLGLSEDAIATARVAQERQPLDSNTYKVLATALFGAGHDEEAVTWLLAGFTVTGDSTLRQGALNFYRSHEERYGCALEKESGGLTLNTVCEPVRRHLCAASAQAVVIAEKVGRKEMVDQLEREVMRPLHCVASSAASPS